MERLEGVPLVHRTSKIFVSSYESSSIIIYATNVSHTKYISGQVRPQKLSLQSFRRVTRIDSTTFILNFVFEIIIIIGDVSEQMLYPYPPVGCGVVERHLEMAQPTTTTKITFKVEWVWPFRFPELNNPSFAT